MILVSGDSFTFGEELPDSNSAWPWHLDYKKVVSSAQPGYGNDAIVNSVVTVIEANPVDYVIVAWTTPHRIEVNGKHLTPSSHRKYGSICDYVFLDWDEEWAVKKFHNQVALLTGYLKSKNIPSVFVKTFEVPDSTVGNWVTGSMVEWMGDCPKGPDGHPLELGHKRIAKHINEHIRNIGWLS
jgi:hypothetical protein